MLLEVVYATKGELLKKKTHNLSIVCAYHQVATTPSPFKRLFWNPAVMATSADTGFNRTYSQVIEDFTIPK